MEQLQAQVNQQAQALQQAQEQLHALQLQQAQAVAEAQQAHAPAAGDHLDVKMCPRISNVDGGEWLIFIRKFRRLLGLTGWNNARAIEQMYLAADGEAYKALEGIETEGRTLDEVVADAQRKFLPRSRANAAISRFETAKQYRGESLCAWHARLQDLYMQAYPEDEEWRTSRLLKRTFSKNLSNERIMDFVLTQEPETYDDCLEAAHNREGTLAMLPSNQSQARHQGAGLHAVGEQGGQRGACYVCGSTDHYQARCPQATAETSRPAQSQNKPRWGRRGRGGRHRPRVSAMGDDQHHQHDAESKN